MISDSPFCELCPCVWCSAENGTEYSGVREYPNLSVCKVMFEKEPELTYEDFIKAVFEIHHAKGVERYV